MTTKNNNIEEIKLNNPIGKLDASINDDQDVEGIEIFDSYESALANLRKKILDSIYHEFNHILRGSANMNDRRFKESILEDKTFCEFVAYADNVGNDFLQYSDSEEKYPIISFEPICSEGRTLEDLKNWIMKAEPNYMYCIIDDDSICLY